MMKNFLTFALIILSIICYSQVGIGTENPRGTLEVTSGNDKSFGLVLPSVEKVEDVKNAINGQVVANGTVVYDEKRKAVCYKIPGGFKCTNGDKVIILEPEQQAYVKASNTNVSQYLGWSVALSADGNTLAVGAHAESSNATGINGDQTNTLSQVAGAVYVFTRSGTNWEQQAYIKASNTNTYQYFGWSVALSADGNTLAVGAHGERSNTTGINGDQTNTSLNSAGAVYVFTRSGTNWEQQAYVKASNTKASQNFGWTVALSADGNTLAVGAYGESSNATGINGDQTNTSLIDAGAVYVFRRSGTNWEQQAYIKASNTKDSQYFGWKVALSADGNTLAVAAYGEKSNATGINGDQTNTLLQIAGAVYVFTRSGTNWEQQAYVKASNTNDYQYFGGSVALSADGNTLAVGAYGESSNATGINGDQTNTLSQTAGAVYVFTRSGTNWEQQTYVKASNTNVYQNFGGSAALSVDGNTLAVGAHGESSNATGINGDQTNRSLTEAGAVYAFKLY